MKWVIDKFATDYEWRFGLPYPGKDYGRAGKDIKALPPAYTQEKLTALVDAFFSSLTDFELKQRGVTLAAFIDRIPQLVTVGTAARGGAHAAVVDIEARRRALRGEDS